MKIESLNNLTKEELYKLAREHKVEGRTDMSQAELRASLTNLMLETGKTKIEAELRDLGTPVIGIGSSDKKLPSSLDSVKGASVTSEKVEPSKVKSPYFDGDSLPEFYGEDKIVLMPKNPKWAYVYWEITPERVERAKYEFGDYIVNNSVPTIRVYDVSMVNFDGSNSNSYFDIELEDGIKEWFIGGLNPNATYVTDYGLKTNGGTFITLLRSEPTATPSDSVSVNIDEEWMMVEEYFKKIWERSSAGRLVDGKWIGGMGASGAILGSSEEMLALMLKRMFLDKGANRDKLLAHLERELGSIGVSSLSAGGSIAAGSLSVGSFSISKEKSKGAIPIKEKIPGETPKKDFWLRVGTELILYGATEPDADVTVMGKKIDLRADGTFSFRYALPNGHYELPVVATSADGDETRWVKPIVDRTEEADNN